MARASEADRLRRCRETFVFAVAHGLSMQDARQKLTESRWADADARLAARRGASSDDRGTPPAADALWMMRD